MNTKNARPPVVLPVGPFGEAVAERLGAAAPAFETVTGVAAAGARPVVLASWRPSRAVARELDGTPGVPWWLPVTYTHPVIHVGPVLGPGLPGCHECLETRVLSTDPRPEYVEALWDLYDEDPSAGPPGHLGHHAVIAAGLARALAGEPTTAVRSLYTYHVLTGDIISHTFVPLPSCPRWAGRTGDVAGRDGAA
ncbi:TOMM precursor leader peptide-binding protein [Kitasatospora cineracea]|uniref:TOMM precursor leader peptide-binding protein n=1 Tax=Kitasatospora TaxID=2063 RepID=UPI0012FF5A94|nr:TOMM precursor leader peptide-binding protein [Kitasatospora sp. NRRL B-11411]